MDGNQSCSSIDNSIASIETDIEIDSEHDNIPLIGSNDQSFQLDGNQSCSSIDKSIPSIDTDSEGECTIAPGHSCLHHSEIDSDPLRAVLVSAQQQPGQPFALDVDISDKLEAPSSLPLTMVAYLRSAYNKVNNLRTNLNTLGLDLLVASESWERPRMPLEELLGSPTSLLFLTAVDVSLQPLGRTEGTMASSTHPKQVEVQPSSLTRTDFKS